MILLTKLKVKIINNVVMGYFPLKSPCYYDNKYISKTPKVTQKFTNFTPT